MLFEGTNQNIEKAILTMREKPLEEAKLALPISVGKWVRHSVKDIIVGHAFTHDIELKIEERKGLFKNHYLVLAKGDGESVAGLLEVIVNIKKAFN